MTIRRQEGLELRIVYATCVNCGKVTGPQLVPWGPGVAAGDYMSPLNHKPNCNIWLGQLVGSKLPTQGDLNDVRKRAQERVRNGDWSKDTK